MIKTITMLVLASVMTLSASAQQRNLAVWPKTVEANESRVALVIGNGAYQSSPLKNPINDSRAIAAKLRTLGFDVIERENLTQKQIGSVLREFKYKIKPGAVALFFYAGHGLQVKGVNYLPTVDAEIASEEDVPTQSIQLNQILELMDESRTRMNLVFLDACRNNPYIRNFRSVSKGLSSVNAPSGTLISFATRPGSVAADGVGSNGIYTEQLLANMDKPMPIEQVLKNVASGVKAATNGRQEPWMEGSIEGDFYFVRPVLLTQENSEKERNAQEATIRMAVEEALKKAAQIHGAQQQTPQSIAFNVELSYWELAKDSRDRKDSELYLAKYPSGHFAELARNRIANLQREEEENKRTAARESSFVGKTNTNYKEGDSYQYQLVDLMTGITRQLPKETVTRVTSTDITYDAGPMKTDLLGNFKNDPTGTRRYYDFPQIFIPEYKVGKTWTSRVRATYLPRTNNPVDVDYVTKLTVGAKEIITVPAGTFETFRITGVVNASNGLHAELTVWVAPDKLNRYVAYEYRTTGTSMYTESDRIELVSFAEERHAQSASTTNFYGYTIGDRYTTQRTDMIKQKIISKNEMVIGAFLNNTIVSLDKNVVLKADGSPKFIRNADGNSMEWSDSYIDRPAPENLKVGHKQNIAWTYSFKFSDGSGEESRSHKGTMEVVGIETVKVPAGQFEAYKIVRRTRFVGKQSWQAGENRGFLTVTNWYVPSIRAIVVSQVDVEGSGNDARALMYERLDDQTISYREELTSYQVAKTQFVQRD